MNCNLKYDRLVFNRRTYRCQVFERLSANTAVIILWPVSLIKLFLQEKLSMHPAVG